MSAAAVAERPLPTTAFHDDMTLGEARALLRALVHDGHRCPCCTQHAQVYRWSLYATAARLLIALYVEGGTDRFIESKKLKHPGQGGDGSRLRHWGLAESEKDRRPDGGKSGFWRVTPLGESFARGEATIPKYAYVYDGRCLRTDGPRVSIEDVLGKTFNYAELMAGV